MPRRRLRGDGRSRGAERITVALRDAPCDGSDAIAPTGSRLRIPGPCLNNGADPDSATLPSCP